MSTTPASSLVGSHGFHVPCGAQGAIQQLQGFLPFSSHFIIVSPLGYQRPCSIWFRFLVLAAKTMSGSKCPRPLVHAFVPFFPFPSSVQSIDWIWFNPVIDSPIHLWMSYTELDPRALRLELWVLPAKKKCCATYPNAKQQRCCGVLKCAVVLRNWDPGWPQAHLLARRFLEMTPPWSTCESASLIII